MKLIESRQHDSKADAQRYAWEVEESGFTVTIKGPCRQHGWLTLVEEKEFREMAD